jgi:hypothetical protein
MDLDRDATAPAGVDPSGVDAGLLGRGGPGRHGLRLHSTTRRLHLARSDGGDGAIGSGDGGTATTTASGPEIDSMASAELAGEPRLCGPAGQHPVDDEEQERDGSDDQQTDYRAAHLGVRGDELARLETALLAAEIALFDLRASRPDRADEGDGDDEGSHADTVDESVHHFPSRRR